jgi:hypothetical protein
MCPQLAIIALNPHFSGYAMTTDIGMYPPRLLHQCRLDFYFLCFTFINLSLDMCHVSVSFFKGQFFCHFLQALCCTCCKGIFDRRITQSGSCSFVLVHILILFGYSLGRFWTPSVVAGCDAIFEVDDDSSGESSKSHVAITKY